MNTLDPMSTLVLMHSYIGAVLVFKGPIASLQLTLLFLKAKGSINPALVPGTDTALFTAEVNHCKQNHSKFHLGPGLSW